MEDVVGRWVRIPGEQKQGGDIIRTKKGAAQQEQDINVILIQQAISPCHPITQLSYLNELHFKPGIPSLQLDGFQHKPSLP